MQRYGVRPFHFALLRRTFSTHSGTLNAARPAGQQRFDDRQEDEQRSHVGGGGRVLSEPAQLTKLPNQLTVASVENNSLITRIAVAVKAGPRYEPSTAPGISHVLRNAASLATRHCSSFALTRTMEQLGCNMAVTNTREHIIYVVEGPRNHIEQALPFFASVLTEPEFRHWELGDARARLTAEVAEYEAQPELVAVELLHDAAYRSSLRNSLYVPKFSVSGISAPMVKEYHDSMFQPNRMAIGGLGVDQSTLLSWASDYFGDLTQKASSTSSGSADRSIADSSASSSGKPRYVGGQRREETSDYISYAVLASEGAAMTNVKEYLAAAMLHHYLGCGPAMKWPGDAYSRLSKAASGASQNPFGVSAFNASYSDSGLFGFSVVSAARDASGILRACFQQMKAVADGGISSDKHFDGTKDAVKAKIGRKFLDCGKTYVRSIAVQALEMGDVLTPEALLSEVDSVSPDDVKSFSSKLKKTGLSMGAVGNLSHTPFLEDIIKS